MKFLALLLVSLPVLAADPGTPPEPVFTIALDTSELESQLGEISEKQLAFAAVNAINGTAKALQEEIRADVEGEFTLRKRDFVLRQAAIVKPFASVRQGRPFAEIAVGQRPRLLLSRFEQGGERPVTSGAKAAAAPVVRGPARPTFGSGVTPTFRYKALRLRKRKDGQRRGAQRTYAVPGTGVFQRRGEGKGSESRMVYAFVEGQRLEKRLGFLETARAKGAPELAKRLRAEVVEAIERAKLRALR